MIIGPGISFGNGVLISAPTIYTNGLLLSLDAATSVSGSTWANTGSLGSNLDYALWNTVPTTSVNGYAVLNFAGGNSQAPGAMTNQYAFNSTGFGTALDSANGFTLDIWCCPNTTTDAGCIIKEWGQGTNNQPTSGWEDAWISFSGGNIQVGFWTGSAAYGSAGAYTANNWYNIVMIYNGSNTLTAYVNNSLTLTRTQTRVAQGSNCMFTVAACERFNYQGTNKYFSGYIGAFKVYNRALTATQVNQNFQALQMRYGV